MSLGAIAGALSGTGTGMRKNRAAQLEEDKYQIVREQADRLQDQYERQMAWQDIVGMFQEIDPSNVAEQPMQAPPANQPVLGSEGLPGASTAPAGDTLGVLGMGGEASAPPPKPKSYREKYKEVDQKARNLAMRAGGLELMDQYEKWRRHTTQQMVLSYGEQAERLLDKNDIGGAAKLANTALEATPLDLGMKFFAKNGELYLEGPTGEVNGPYNADQFDVLFKQHMKTPENFLEIEKFEEQKRATKEAEADTDARIGVAQSQANTAAGWLKIAQDKFPAEMSKIGAEIYSMIRNADAAYMRAQEQEGDGRLSEATIRDINESIPTLIQNAKIDPGSQWWGAMTQNPGAGTLMQSAAIDTAKLNLMGEGNYADAIGIAAFAVAPIAGVEPPSDMNMGGFGIDENGQYYAMWNGKPLFIPPSLYLVLKNQEANLRGAQQGKAPPALDPFRE